MDKPTKICFKFDENDNFVNLSLIDSQGEFWLENYLIHDKRPDGKLSFEHCKFKGDWYLLRGDPGQTPPGKKFVCDLSNLPLLRDFDEFRFDNVDMTRIDYSK